jgi:hypothetical protein
VKRNEITEGLKREKERRTPIIPVCKFYLYVCHGKREASKTKNCAHKIIFIFIHYLSFLKIKNK